MYMGYATESEIVFMITAIHFAGAVVFIAEAAVQGECSFSCAHHQLPTGESPRVTAYACMVSMCMVLCCMHVEKGLKVSVHV